MQKIQENEIINRLTKYDYEYLGRYDNERKVIGQTPDGYKVILDCSRIKESKHLIYKPDNPFIVENIKHFLKVNNIGTELVSDKYANRKTPLLWRCSCGDEFYQSWDTFNKGTHFCQKCAGEMSRAKRRKYTVEDISNILLKKGLLL